jgi:ketosteroid isomerase-like protein
VTSLDDVVRDGLQAWNDGDLDALAGLLSADAELLWYEPGPWDCHGADQIMALLRQRQSEGQARPQPLRIDHVEDHTIVVSAADPTHRSGSESPTVATVATIRGGKIIRLRQHRSRAEALAATTT